MPTESQHKPNQYLMTVNDVTMNDQTAIFFPQSGQLSITYTTSSAKSQTLTIADGTTVTPISLGTHVYLVKFGAALRISGTGNGYVAFQLSWEYVG